MKAWNPSHITFCRMRTQSVWMAICVLLLPYVRSEALAAPPSRAETGKVSEYFVFSDAGPLNTAYVSKPWTESESSDVQANLDDILLHDPGLIELASSGGKIRLFRMSRIPFQADGPGARRILAIASQTELYISDQFFEQKPRLRILIHELAHLADAGGHIAYSLQWVKFALPPVENVRALLSKGIAPEHIDAWLRAYRILPGFDSCRNLKEALADDYAALILGEAYPMEISAASRLIRATKRDKSFECYFQQGLASLAKGEFHDAVLKFSLARDIDTTAPLCHLYLARSYFGLRDFESSREECKIALRRFDEVGVPAEESDKRNTVHLFAVALMNLGQYGEARDFLQNVLSSESYRNLRAKANDELEYCVRKLGMH